MTDLPGGALWAARMVIQWGGAALAAQGYGDDAMWQAVGGAVLTAGGAVWSWRARKAQIASVPAETPTNVADAMIERIRGMLPK